MAAREALRLIPNWGGSGLAAYRTGMGERILWLHGYTMDATIWRDLWSALPEYEHVGLDLPGHGVSPPLERGETLSTLGRRLRTAAQAESVRHVAGVSFGGMVALAAALDDPQWFHSMLLNSPAIGGGAQDPEAQQLNLELHRLHRTRGVGPWLVQRWMESPPDIFTGCRRHPDLWSRLEAIFARHSWDELTGGALQQLTLHSQSMADLGRLRAAVLLVLGEQDMPSVLRSAEIIRRAIRRCTRVYVPDAGHLAFLEVPAAAAHLVRAHVTHALRSTPG